MKNTKVTARDILSAEKANNHLFNERLVAEPHSIIVTGKANGKDKEGKSKWKFMDTSSPNADAVSAGVGKTRFFRTAFKKAGSIVEYQAPTGKTVKALRGSKRNIAETTFENVQPNLFMFITSELKEGNYKELGTDKNGNKLIELDAVVYGKNIKAITPTFKLFNTDENGKRVPLMSGTYNHEQKRYIKKQATNDNITMFVEEDDLDGLISVVSKKVEREVMPNLVSTVTIIKETATSTETKVETPETTADEDLNIDDPANPTDQEDEDLDVEETDDDEDNDTI